MRIIAIIIFILFSLQLSAQQPNRADLEKRRQAIMEAIRQTEEQLEATKKNKNASLSQLRALQNKLAERQKLINNINDEIENINTNINHSTQEVSHLRNNLEILKARYAQSVRYAYQTRSSYNMLAFLFSANDFNEALRRLKYLRKYRDYRKEQADQIRITQGQIVRKIGVLNNEKNQKDVLLSTQEQQKMVILKESDETNLVVKELKGKEKELMTEIEKNRKAAKQLDRTIADIIRREIEIARKKAEEEAMRKAEEERKRREDAAKMAGPNPYAPKPPAGSKVVVTQLPSTTPARVAKETPSYALSLTPEVAALSNSFEMNRGRLPWPVEKGFISEPFGRHQHAVAEKVTVENNGLEIQTSANATARAVFDGEVSAVIYIPGMGQSVLINHGQYFTVYTRLGNVLVKKGDKVHTKQPLGSVILNDDDVPMMHFELWKVGAHNAAGAIDPATWIAR
jgi:septal ring factor EnvC (AmiA/AmiB activator)